MVDLSKLDGLTDTEEARFISAFTRELASDAGDEAKRHLAAGRAIYVGDDRFPDSVVKQHPDGRRQLVDFKEGVETVIRDL